MLKVVPVKLHSKGRTLSIHAILDDRSERTIILSTAIHYLQLERVEESLKQQEMSELQGASVSFEVSALGCSQMRHHISNVFIATELNHAKQSCPMDILH